jgi:uncharacterized membrane protein
VRWRDARDDRGSILPLTFAYGALGLAVVLVCADATSLYLAQKRLDAVADSAALAGADGFVLELVDGDPVARLTDDGVREQASAIVEAADEGYRLIDATTPDGRSARVTVAGTWHPPVLAVFVPDGVELRAVATTRTALR